MSHKIAIVLGTARPGNNSERVFKFINKNLSDRKDIEIIPVAVSDYLFGKTTQDESEIAKWKEIVSKADGFIFISPEYNHSYPGELKILIDSLYEEYKGKVAGVVGVSMGPYAGVRVSDLLKLLLVTVNFDVINRSFDVSAVSNNFDEEGNPIGDYKEKAEKHLNELVDLLVEKI